jgi:hypothetical protein
LNPAEKEICFDTDDDKAQALDASQLPVRTTMIYHDEKLEQDEEAFKKPPAETI